MSVEAEVRKALRRAVFWRCVTSITCFPRNISEDVRILFDGISDAAFYFELDAARRYRTLTGADLGVASGNAGRYTSLTPEALARVETQLDEQADDDDG